jgi:hypothetical protein
VSELAQMIIKNKAASKGWPLQRYPGKVSLPGSIFKAPHSPEDQRSVVKRVYLPEETLAWFAEQSKVVNKVCRHLILSSRCTYTHDAYLGEAKGRA